MTKGESVGSMPCIIVWLCAILTKIECLSAEIRYSETTPLASLPALHSHQPISYADEIYL